MGQGTCSVVENGEPCGAQVLARGYCSKHYARWRTHGDPLKVKPRGRTATDPVARFWAKVERHGPDECWPWTGWIDADGYGIFKPAGHPVKAHRFAYELLVGPLSSDLTIDHVCHNGSGCAGGTQCPHRRCVNPAHLEAVPMTVNVMRGATIGAINAAKTHCIHGHEFTPENTYIPPGHPGYRICRTCKRMVDVRRRAKG